MGLLCDTQIRERVAAAEMIEPFLDHLVSADPRTGRRVVSYGLSSYGYDIRLGDEFRLFTTDEGSRLVDPKDFDPTAFVTQRGQHCILPPNSFALSFSLEYFKIPRDLAGLCIGKSTYARCGIITNLTPLEAGWEGRLTVEISNTTPLPAKIYAGEGIAQVLFFEGSRPCEVSYHDRTGKYLYQTGITLPKV